MFKINPSEEFQDLFDKMIRFKPDERITLEEIMKHPWFKNPNLPSEDEIKTEAIKIRTFV